MPRIRKSRGGTVTDGVKILVWHIAVYIRLSKEDGNDISKSVVNQKKIIKEYLEQFFEGEYTITDYYIDDGRTGTDDERPDFQRMIADVEAGKVNCIICKTLSRMFRNYSDQGYYVEEAFPRLGTRFISISNTHVDTFVDPTSITGMEVPINGLLNDRYAAKTSEDVRRTFATKRRRGEFIGAFAPYGYTKDPKDKNHLVLDEDAAAVVKNMGVWFLGGMSLNGIAQHLNELGIPNPAKYKRDKGMNYSNCSKENNDGMWSPKTIRDMLRNPMYIGTMVQGREKVVSYKVHDRIRQPESEWYTVEGTHEEIFDKETFEKLQALLERDTRAAPGQRTLTLFAGLLQCADCHKAMRRHSSKGYVYYTCRTYNDKSKTACTKHSIRADVLEEAVLISIQKQIELVDALTEIVEEINNAPIVHTKSLRLSSILKLRQEDLYKLKNLSDGLYADWKGGDITRDEYQRFKEKYASEIEGQEKIIASLECQMGIMEQGVKADNPFLTTFLKYKNIEHLERGIVIDLIDVIYIHEGGGITVKFNFADQYQQIWDFIENNRRELKLVGREAEQSA